MVRVWNIALQRAVGKFHWMKVNVPQLISLHYVPVNALCFIHRSKSLAKRASQAPDCFLFKVQRSPHSVVFWAWYFHCVTSF